MDLERKLLINTLNTVVKEKIEEVFEDLESWTNATSMVMLFEIREIVNDGKMSDSEKVEKISKVYDKYNAQRP